MFLKNIVNFKVFIICGARRGVTCYCCIAIGSKLCKIMLYRLLHSWHPIVRYQNSSHISSLLKVFPSRIMEESPTAGLKSCYAARSTNASLNIKMLTTL